MTTGFRILEDNGSSLEAVEAAVKALKKACQFLLHEELKEQQGDMGIIAIDPKGNIAMEFRSERMHRGYKTGDEEYTGIYPE